MNVIDIRITLIYDEGVYSEVVRVPNNEHGHDLLWAHIAMLLSGYPMGTVAQTEPVNA